MKRGDPNFDLERERARLVAMCAVQRADIGTAVLQLRGPLKIADAGLAGARYLRDRPLLLGVAVAALAATRTRGPWKWVKRGFVAWRAYRSLGRSGAQSLW